MKASREKVDAFLSTIKDIPIELIEDAARLYATSTKRTGEYDSFEAFFRGANPDPLFAAEVVAGTRDYSQAELLYIFGAVHGTAFRTWFDGSKEMKRDLSPSFRQNNYVLASGRPRSDAFLGQTAADHCRTRHSYLRWAGRESDRLAR